jgi:O-antigen/teichoic acid export membrane protein
LSDLPPGPGSERLFQTAHLTPELRTRTLWGGATALFAQALQLGLGLLATALLARLLRPEDFGLVAMATALAGFFLVFKDMGLSLATVQHETIDSARISTLFWIGVGLSLVLAVTLALLAFPFGWLYGEPRVTPITWLLAVAAALGGLTIQHRALLQRQMRFGALAVIDLACVAAGVATGLGLALLGCGYWSLVWMRLAGAATLVLGTWLACDWRPGRPTHGRGVRPILGLGASLTASSVADYVARNLDKVMIGKFVGGRPLGFYAKAYALLMVPLEHLSLSFNAVAIPALSRLADAPERYRTYYREGLRLVAALAMPIIAFAFVCAEPLVRVLLGPQWGEAVPLVRVLGPAAFLETLVVATTWVCVSLGRGDRALRLSAANAAALAAAFLFGLRWGALGVAAAYTATQLLIRPIAIRCCLRHTPVGVKDVAQALWRPALASLVAGVATLGLSLLALEQGAPPRATAAEAGAPAFWRLVGLGLGFVAAYALAWAVQPGGLTLIRRGVGLVSATWRTARRPA